MPFQKGNPYVAKYGFQPGKSGNPGGRPKQVKEFLEAFRKEVPASLALAVRVRDDVGEETKVRLEAAKFICAYGLGAPPKVDLGDASTESALPEGLTLEEVRAIARQPLSTELTGNVADKQPA